MTEPADVPAPHPSVVDELGGEMPFWSDGPLRDEPLLTALVAPLVRSTDHVLVAGAHPSDLVRAVSETAAQVTFFARGNLDGDAAAASPDPTPDRFWSGDLARLPEGERFDLVVAARGLEVLSSADADLRPWSEQLALLTRVVAPGGRLVVGLANDVGLHTLVGAAERRTDDSDDLWYPEAGFDDTRPTTAADLAAALTAATGTDDASCWSVFPTLASPDVVVRSGLPVHGRTLATATITRSMRRLGDDPRGLAARAPIAGRAETLAPAVLAVCGAGSDLDRAWLDAGSVVRPGPEVADRPGASLEQCLLDATLAYDLPRVRQLLEQLRDHLAQGATTGDTIDNLFWPAEGAPSHLVTGSDEPVDPDDALLAAVDAFSRRLAHLGWRHPWPVTYDDVDVTRTLMAGLGTEVDRDAVEAAREVPHADPSRAELDRVRSENEGLRAKMSWFETSLRQRDRSLLNATAKMSRTASPKQQAANKQKAQAVQQQAASTPVRRARRVAGRVRRRITRR